ncbi:MAG: hypothetical protein ACFE9T_04625 [Promethearchaeota archaeon]
MVKKGKYGLFSYLVEDNLIFYKNLSNLKKFIAFSFLEVKSMYPLFSILSNFLIERYIKYFSIQFNPKVKNKKVIILNFEDIEKDRIRTLFNIIYEKLNKSRISIKFLSNNNLEEEFLAIFLNNQDSNLKVLKDLDSLLIEDNKNSKRLTFYRIYLERIEDKSTFIYCFLNLINNFDRKGFLIFYFKLDFGENIKILAYFVEESKIQEDLESLEKKVNHFFDSILLEKSKVKIKEIFKLLWRLGISDNFSLLEYSKDLFLSEDQDKFSILFKFNSKLERHFLRSQIEYKRLNKFLIFIEQWCLLLVLPSLNTNLIQRIIENYHQKYFIYILTLNQRDYDKLLEIEEIRLLKKIKILHPNEFSTLNFKIFKKSFQLENP